MAKANHVIRRCRVCDEELPQGKIQCQSCKCWNVSTRTEEKVLIPGMVDGTITLDQVESSSLDRLTTGFWDICWGCNDPDEGQEPVFGITRGSTTLIGGSPGGGKSTLMMQIAASVAKLHTMITKEPGAEPLYIASEEQLKQIKERGKRLKLEDTFKYIRMVPAMSGAVDLNIILKKFKPPLMILDSLKGMARDDDAMAIEIAQIFKEYAMAYNCPGIIATHATKDDIIAGKLDVQHEVDTTMTLFPDDESFTEDELGRLEPVRILDPKKNRNGALASYEFAMTKYGLIPYVEGDKDEDEEEEEEEESVPPPKKKRAG